MYIYILDLKSQWSSCLSLPNLGLQHILLWPERNEIFIICIWDILIGEAQALSWDSLTLLVPFSSWRWSFSSSHIVCALVLGNASWWYYTSLFSGEGSEIPSSCQQRSFPEVSLLPASILTPQGDFKCNQFVRGCSKTALWNPRADAVIFLGDDWVLLFPHLGK